jgi:uncharacterized protein YndB with AHSA1/START domain
MPTVRRTRALAADPQELWAVVGDPYHLPRWWPRVSRVEGVDRDAFTEVLVSRRGKVVRADFVRVEEQPQRRVVWAQEIDGTPFARVLRSAETAIELEPTQGAPKPSTDVTIELRQRSRGFDWGSRWGVWRSSGSFLVRRAAEATVEEALDGLERIVGG